MNDLRAFTRNVDGQAEDLSSEGIEFVPKGALPDLPTIQTARRGAPYNVVRNRPSTNPLDYLVVYQAAFLVRLFQCASPQSFDLGPGSDAGRRMGSVTRDAQIGGAEDTSALERFSKVTAKWALHRRPPQSMRARS